MTGEYAFRQGEYAEISVITSATAATGRFFVRVRYRNGRIDTLTKTFLTTTTYAAELFTAETPFIEDGVVLNAVVRMDTNLQRGQLYAGLYVTPAPVSGMNVANLCQGYVYSFKNLTLGDSIESGPGSGHGNIRTIQETDVAIATEPAVQTVPANALWRVRAVRGSLVTSADAANRRPGITVTDGTNIKARSETHATQTASLTVNYSFEHGSSSDDTAIAAGQTRQVALADLLLPEGYTIQLLTLNFDAVAVGDDWGAIEYLIEEWIV